MATPDPPTNIDVSLNSNTGAGQVQVSWVPPAHNGGSLITGYSIQYSTDSSFNIYFPIVDISNNASSPIYSTYISGLSPDTEYWFKMAAVNIAGTGSYAISTPPTIKTLMSAPLSLSNNGTTNNSVSLTWLPPNYNSSISDYSVQYSTDNTTWSTFPDDGSDYIYLASQIVTGLSSNTLYYFRVAAENSSNNVISIYCDSITATTLPDPPSVPPPPYIVILNNTNYPGDGQIIISWETTYDGSSPINYNVRYSTDNSTWTIVSISATDYIQNGNTISGLTNGQMYYFQVALENSAGPGQYSPSYTTTIPMLPAPTSVTNPTTIVVPLSGQIIISWIAPQINTGDNIPAITDYYVRYSDNSSGPWTQFIHTPSTDTSQTLSDPSWVTNTTYYFQVAAVQTLNCADGSTILETGTYSDSVTGYNNGPTSYEPLPP